MKVELPILKDELKDGILVRHEKTEVFELDTSVYSEERWEQHFPQLAEREGLFQYIERVQKDSLNERVRVAGMLKALFCFIESDCIKSYKDFAKLFNLAAPEYTEKLINTIKDSFQIVLNGSAVKN